MPPSQLKQLKASLREQGVTGPAQKKKRRAGKDHSAKREQYEKRNAALQRIRADFNPFDFKQSTRPDKFNITTVASKAARDGKPILGRPGVTKSQGEENRRRTLLPELQRRYKVGGIIDRRIGENDPTLTLEDRMLQRFTREAQRRKRDDVFNLEDIDEENQLTHLGRSILRDQDLQLRDDFDERNLGVSDESEHSFPDDYHAKKRERLPGEDNGAAEQTAGDLNERRKSKREAMEEVIAKSKTYKYERQKAKEDDDEIRKRLDEGLTGLLALLRGGNDLPNSSVSRSGNTNSSMHPDRAAQLENGTGPSVDKEYDQRVRQMMLDKKAQPVDRTKTETEKAEEEVSRLQELEEQRLRRMNGASYSSESDDARESEHFHGDDTFGENHAAEFNIKSHTFERKELDVEDEDDFIIDEDLVASGSEIGSDFAGFRDVVGSKSESDQHDDDMDFLKDVMTSDPQTTATADSGSESASLAYTYPCPQTHLELLKVFEGVSPADQPTIVQRIRALYHPSLQVGNKSKLGQFSAALVDHISYMAVMKPPLAVVETFIRHIHSLSRTYPDGIAMAFRAHLLKMHRNESLTPGDLIILTAIGTIYPASDHFHQVVTPAITIIARYLEITTPTTEMDHLNGSYLVALCVRYQMMSKRYIPEAIRFTLAALKSNPSNDILKSHIGNISALTELWGKKSAFIEMFQPLVIQRLEALHQTRAINLLQISLNQSRLTRRPLELHHHRPLPIKSSIPRFEEGFNPDKHYDHDRERAEANKLRAEYKKEHKGALRELKKDAMFIARERLKEKKNKDKAYEANQRRLIAEIQGEEGHEKNAYEREKRARKGKR